MKGVDSMNNFQSLASAEQSAKTSSYLKGICNYFDIVTAPYTDFNGEDTIGLFLIVYLESKDSAIPLAKNCVGLKITSKDSYPSKYRVPITKAQCPKLAQDSYIYVNHPYTLSTKNCVNVCRLPDDLYRQVSTRLVMYTSNMNNQLVSSISNKLTLKN
jgi:hypothetical protein